MENTPLLDIYKIQLGVIDGWRTIYKNVFFLPIVQFDNFYLTYIFAVEIKLIDWNKSQSVDVKHD